MHNPSLSLSVEHHAGRFALSVNKQHIDGRFEKLTLHALREDLTIPMILLAGRGRVLRKHDGAIAIDGRKYDWHLEPALLKEEQDLPYVLRSLLNIHHRDASAGHSLRALVASGSGFVYLILYYRRGLARDAPCCERLLLYWFCWFRRLRRLRSVSPCSSAIKVTAPRLAGCPIGTTTSPCWR